MRDITFAQKELSDRNISWRNNCVEYKFLMKPFSFKPDLWLPDYDAYAVAVRCNDKDISIIQSMVSMFKEEFGKECIILRQGHKPFSNIDLVRLQLSEPINATT